MPLQRNVTDGPLDVWAASATVQPGDTLDWPDPLIGFEPVPQPSPTKTSRKQAAVSAGEESAA